MLKTTFYWDKFYKNFNLKKPSDFAIFIAKRKLEMQLEQAFPDYYSKYSLVTFNENIPYSMAMKKGRKQDELLKEICQRSDFAELSLEQVFNEVKNIVV